LLEKSSDLISFELAKAIWLLLQLWVVVVVVAEQAAGLNDINGFAISFEETTHFTWWTCRTCCRKKQG
jgi:hypothetical protein